MRIIEDKNFKDEVKEGVVLVDFFASWCGPCRMMGAILEEVDGKIDGLKIVKLDTDEITTVAREFGIMSIPTLIIFKDGQMQEKHIGVWQKEDMIESIRKYL